MRRGITLVNFYRNGVNLPKKCLFTTSAVFQQPKKDSERFRLSDFNKERIKNYEDTFGDIDSFEIKFQRIKEDPEDLKEYERDKAAQGKSVLQYIKEIKQHLENNDYESAIRTLEVDMHNDRKPAVRFIYETLVCFNANRGNLTEAYRLYLDFKKRGGKMTGGLYTSLFNACANCRNSLDAINKANSLRESLINDKNHNANLINYNAMLKAYGRHGDLPTCLKIFDEVLEKRGKVKPITYSFLLNACLSDTNSGLRHALILWRKMLQNRVKPDVFSFNDILRCIKECSLGETTLVNNFIKMIETESQVFIKRKMHVKTTKKGDVVRKMLVTLADGSKMIAPEGNNKDPTEATDNVSRNISEENISEKKTEEQSESLPALTSTLAEGMEDFKFSSPTEPELPNLLALRPSVGSFVNFGEINSPADRFKLVGGFKGFLNTMSDFQIKPDVKTFTLMLDVLPSTREAEEEIMAEARALGVFLDTTFYNLLMRRRIFRGENSEDVLKLFQENGLTPDVVTFGVLASECRTCEAGLQLILEARRFGVRLNDVVLGALLKNAGFAKDMKYVKGILDAAKEDEVFLGPKFIARLGTIIEQEKLRRKQEKRSEEVNLKG